MNHIVIGTAGHIDHGKTALLKSLTGYDADRLPEEKARGMTIDLGFVFLGDDVTIIDVPGHEKFIKNMLAGVSTIDLVILVIAADDGIMPQTREHFEILQLLDIRKGLIALTKTDIVDEEILEIVKDDISAFVKGTFLENAPLIPVSNITGEGVKEFHQVLLKAIEETPVKSDKDIFRMWIDRVFVLKGIGTIVAGTVLSGKLKAGDWIDILPQNKKVRARKIQVHNKDVSECKTGERAALNLMGIEVSEIHRGSLLGETGRFEVTYIVNAKLYLLKSAPKPLQNRTRIRFHIGTNEILARVILLEKKSINPGESGFVQLRLEAPVSADYGDRFIIRSYSPAYTIGGGKVVEIKPQKLKYLPEKDLEKLEKIEEADPGQLLLHALANSPLETKTISKICSEISVAEKKIDSIIDNFTDKNLVTVIGEKPVKSILLTDQLENAKERITDFLKKYHKQFPMRSGIKKSELRIKIFGTIESPVFDFIISSMYKENKINISGEMISLSGYKIEFTPGQEEIRKKIEKIYLDSKFVTPSTDEIIEEFKDHKKEEIQKVISGMFELGILMELKGPEKNAVFHSKNVEEAKKILMDVLKEKKEIRLGEYRELINSTRKYATPLLNYFDNTGVTIRDGDIRRLKSP